MPHRVRTRLRRGTASERPLSLAQSASALVSPLTNASGWPPGHRRRGDPTSLQHGSISTAATRETGRGCYLLQRLPSASRGAPLCLQPRAVRAPPAPLLVHGLLPLLPQAELPAAPARAIISSHVGRPLRDLRGGEEG